jgi:hypothetical protein
MQTIDNPRSYPNAMSQVSLSEAVHTPKHQFALHECEFWNERFVPWNMNYPMGLNSANDREPVAET